MDSQWKKISVYVMPGGSSVGGRVEEDMDYSCREYCCDISSSYNVRTEGWELKIQCSVRGLCMIQFSILVPSFHDGVFIAVSLYNYSNFGKK